MYSSSRYTYSDESLLGSYEVEVSQIYERLGYQVRFIAAYDLIAMDGAVHCITMQIPESKPQI